jgi:protein-disulfide isomerase
VFWKLHDFLFSRQATLTDATLNASISEFATKSAEFRLDQYQRCMADHSAERALARDETLADTYHVDATPTVFINGVRKVGFGSLEQLRAAIRSAMTEHQKGRAGE